MKKGRSGGGCKMALDLLHIANIPLRKHSSIRSLASDLDIPKSTLHARIKEGLLKVHSNALKHYLTENNKIHRLKFCISMLNPISIANNNLVFEDMYNIIHVDEKWFNTTKDCQKYYLLPEEVEPHRTCKSKRFITKVMFFAAVACPRFDTSRNQHFDGKLGIWSFVCQEPAKRSSKNRPAGAMETKPCAVDKAEYRRMMLENVLPSIWSKWPRSGRSQGIVYIQQDNAKPHISPNDEQFNMETLKDTGSDIRLTCQPPSSPDLNALDLGFFRASQTLQY